jgi:hypothetical protein
MLDRLEGWSLAALRPKYGLSGVEMARAQRAVLDDLKAYSAADGSVYLLGASLKSVTADAQQARYLKELVQLLLEQAHSEDQAPQRAGLRKDLSSSDSRPAAR